MSEITFRKILWNNQDNHDKLWVSFEIDETLYCAWGRRGGRLSFKVHGKSKNGPYQSHAAWKLGKIENQKESKGYKEVDNFLLFSIFPDFEEKVEQELVLKLMAGKIR